MEILVGYESSRGRAEYAARSIADAAAVRGIASIVLGIDGIGPEMIAQADAFIVGCWTPGKIPFGDQPTRRLERWIDGLSPLDGMPVAVFCTYRFFPHTFADTGARTAETLHGVAEGLELRGGKVVATQSMYIGAMEKAASVLTDRMLEHLH